MSPPPPLTIHAWLRYDAIRRLLPRDANSILEIGAGLGSTGVLLSRRRTYVGLEPDIQSFETARRRIGDRGTILAQRVESYEAAEPFDVVCAFEVLEHIGDDKRALTAWRAHVKKGGWLLLSVPAGRDRFGPSDERVGHYRRYDRSDLVAVLEDTGYGDVSVIAYGFPLGHVLEAGRNLFARRLHSPDGSMDDRTAGSGRWLQPPESAAQLTRLLSAPFRYLQRPFGGTDLGTGFVARARRPA